MTDKLFKVGFMTLLLVLTGYIVGVHTLFASASAPSGSESTVATSSPVLVGPHLVGTSTKSIVMSATGNCASRIITTTDRAIYLSFGVVSSSTIVASSTTGHLQATSTTVAYDSGLYGCGLWSAVAIASTSIMFTETR